jgi:hypothetical protein
MKNKRFWLGMLVMVLVFGMTIAGCKDDDSSPTPTPTTTPPATGDSGLTITGLGSYNGKYAIAMNDSETNIILAAASIDYANETLTGGMISGGSITLKVWKLTSTGYVSYTGSDSVDFGVMILNRATWDFEDQTAIVGYGLVSVKFSNGVATGAFTSY